MKPTIKIVGLTPDQWSRAGRLAKTFLDEFPDKKVGIYHGCVYSNGVDPNLYIYKTKTQIVVRPTENAD